SRGKNILIAVLLLLPIVTAKAQLCAYPNDLGINNDVHSIINAGDTGNLCAKDQIIHESDSLAEIVQPDSCMINACDSVPSDSSGPEKQKQGIDVVDKEPGLDVERLNSTTFSPVFFIKTNLLYDLLTLVNASVEVRLAKRLTAEATIVYPWWRNTAKHKTVQLRYVAVTPRYYFRNTEKPYTSFFVGLTAGLGSYDLQWTRRGVQGDLWTVSPTFGYSHHISKRWKMEYSVSVGYVQTKYRKYTQIADTPYGEIKVRDYPWVSHVLRTVLPISLSVSIVYSIGKQKEAEHHEG
ncbi:MAG: DUF3575 domain-containing protein, partial [Muribaculaceae bacterium]